jgi:hypothetical protein
MSTFTERANVDCRLSFAENKRKFAASVSRLQQTNGSCCHFPLFQIYGIYIPVHIYLYIYLYIYIYIHIYVAVSNAKWNWQPRQVSLIRLPFAHHADGSLSFVHSFTKKLTEVIHLQNGINRVNGLAHLWFSNLSLGPFARFILPGNTWVNRPRSGQATLDIEIFIAPLNLPQTFEVLMRPTLNAYQSPSVHTSRIMISLSSY